MSVFLILFLGVLAFLVRLAFRVGSRDPNLPPGPPTIPLLGNMLQMPTHHAFVQFTEWAKIYGGMYSLKIGTGTIVVLTERRLIKELLDKKSSIYSKRPASYLSDFITGGDHVLLMDYSPKWRAVRKAIHQHFMESMVIKDHTKVVDAEAVQMCRDFLIDPAGHMLHPRRYGNSITMSLVYGVRTPSTDTPHMLKLFHHLEQFSELMEPGSTPPVDHLPFLMHIPEFLLGNWKTRASQVSKQMNALYSQYLDVVITRREKGVMKGSFMDAVLDQQKNLALAGVDRHSMYFLGGTMMEGGSDTTSALISSFVHAMTKWPEVMRKAQRELDSVIGEDRTPTFDDYDNLPYIAATVKESMRWRPVGALGTPHCVSEDDWIDGKLIPKGSAVFLNIWGTQHDEKYFPNHDMFDPDHYLGVTKLAPELAASADYEKRDHYGYGTGRRLCPGIHLAERNLFLGIAKLLWAFDFGPGTDANGVIIEPDVEVMRTYSAGFLTSALPYPCTITVRSEGRKATILKEFGEAEKDIFSRFD